MRYLATIALCLTLVACGNAGTAPLDLESVRAVLLAALDVLNTGVEREDPILASQPISDRFSMNNNIAVRYLDEGWTGKGAGKFREFFDEVFEIHANIEQQLVLIEVDLQGEVATARVGVDFSSLRVDRTPPENHTASGEDYFIFEREDGSWRLIRWDEALVMPPQDGGSDEDL